MDLAADRVLANPVAARVNPAVLPAAADRLAARTAKPAVGRNRTVAAARPEQAVRPDPTFRWACPGPECHRSEFRCRPPAARRVAVQVSRADRQARIPLTPVEVLAAERLITRAFSPARAAQAAAGSRGSQVAPPVRKVALQVRAAVAAATAGELPGILARPVAKPVAQQLILVQAPAKAMAKMVDQVATRTPEALRAAVNPARRAKRAAETGVAVAER